MRRRCMIAVAVSGLAAMAGCGLIQSNMPAIQAHRPGAASRTFDAPVSAVVQAAIEASGVGIDLDEEMDFNIESVQFARDDKGAAKLVGDPSDHTYEIADLTYGIGSWTGKTKDGRPATIWFRPLDHFKKAEATVFVGKHGDPELSRAFLERVADKLAHPAHPKGEPPLKKATVEFDFNVQSKDATTPTKGKAGP